MTVAIKLIEDADFQALRAYVYDTCGIALDNSKHSLVSGRLQPVLAREHIATYREYIDRVRSDTTGRLRSELVDRLSTNHTFFWREADHFDFLSRVALPAVIAARRRAQSKTLRIWCAASSAGQEPYTLGALAMEALGVDYPAWDAGVLATDISAPVLERAREGIYDNEDVQRLPESLRKRHFDRLPDGRWQANRRLREELTFRRLNLMSPRFPFKQPFDIVFIRNVMIYFDMPTKLALMDRLAAVMRPGAFMFIGAAESLPPDQRQFESVRPGVFRKP
ncbi:MAG: protein-glutamate O-methyltransferase CheR [Nannocystaceae bacterium]